MLSVSNMFVNIFKKSFPTITCFECIFVKIAEVGVAAHAHNPNIQESVGQSITSSRVSYATKQGSGQPGPHREIMFQNKYHETMKTKQQQK